LENNKKEQKTKTVRKKLGPAKKSSPHINALRIFELKEKPKITYTGQIYQIALSFSRRQTKKGKWKWVLEKSLGLTTAILNSKNNGLSKSKQPSDSPTFYIGN